MDGFNPLDLLASAAELQQKNDDGPERIIVTRQRRTAATSKPGLTVGQKENRELNKNNNNYINKGKPNVVIVKKLKKVEVNPELEKMLDEHNYGNAKRTVNHEHSYGNAKRTKSGDSVVEIHNHSRKRSESEKLDHSNTEPSVSSHKVTITGGQSKDKVTTVISNTNCSQLSDSECINLGKCTVECSDKNTCSHTCVNRICLCSCKHETTESKCSYIHEENANDSSVNKTEKDFIDQLKHSTGIDQSGDNETKSCISKCDNKFAKKDKISGTCSSLEQSVSVEDNLRLDEHTGEFISKKGDSFSVKNVLSRDDECEDKMVPVIFDSTCVNREPISEVGPCLSADNDATSSVVKKVSKSNTKKMPHVTVISSDVVSDSLIDNKSETLVINISGGHTAETLTKQVTSNKQQFQSNELVAESDGKNTNVGIIRSLIINDLKNDNDSESENKKKSVVLNLMSPKTSKLEMPHCNSHRLNDKADSYSSFKELEFSDSVCEEDSTTSVHLLSPDRRNPDSMGIVESPVTQNVNELNNSGKFEDSCGHSFDNLMETDDHVMPNCHDSCEKESNIKTSKSDTRTDHVESTSLFLNTTHSDSALEVELPIMESVSDSRELSETNLLPDERLANCDNSANSSIPPSTSGADIPIFRFDSDHCYAGIPRTEKTCPVRTENESSIPSENEEARTPLGSNSELSQDSGYEDVTQSPEIVQPAKNIEEESVERTQNMKNLVPVLVSVNSNGSLTVHDTDLTKTLNRQVFLPDNMKVISGSNITPISQPSLILSPVAVAGKTSQVNFEVPKLVQPKPDGILELLSPKTTEIKSSAVDAPESPLTFGTFKIGTFASFSNTGMGLESPKKVAPVVKQVNEDKPKKVSPSSRSRSNSGKSGKSSPVVDTLGTLVQKVKSSLSPASSVDWSGIDHLQHDHDYCTKNLMPSVVSSFLEARLLSKDTPRSKVTHSKGKKSDMESLRSETKSGKRKKISNSLSKEDFIDDVDIDSECDTHSIPEPAKQKYRGDKFIEPKRTDPKVKITGSSNFQDQFVYFMNTKKRSRRRESKDTPLPSGSERVFIPPKPGDIIVPHLTDQDIENLKIRSKQSKQPSANAGYNSLRNEFMAAKLSNGTFSTSQSAETVDDEKNIINTILSLENEDLSSPVHSESSVYNESMEMYGQGLGSDIMNLLPEQMNLTQEQMDLLYSAVDEVQNSSPGLIGTDKLVSAEAANPAFQFPMSSFVESNASADSPQTTEDEIPDKKVEASKPAKSEVDEENNRDQEINEDRKDVKSSSNENGDEPISGNDVKSRTEQPDNSISTSQNAEETKVIDNTEGNNKTDEKVDNSVVSDIPSDGADKSIPLPPEQPCIPASTSSGCFSLASSVAPFDTFTSSVSVSDAVISTGPAGDASRDKPLFSTSSPSSGLVTQSSFSSDLSSVSSTPISSEIALPSIDKSLDLLGNIRFDRGDLFSEASVGGVSQAPASSVPTPSQVDYNAPWIVTVSMYWNDLPAIMINNQPFVRLVDIHKQILPAKDTGILKKRCQLMGIEVENCSEMQRYFLVQYGKAINSKSTLIISKDSAKVLIGYYVEPQPKAARLDDHHKSIIDHRREQLRRIALARRAAVRAQRLSEKKDEPDPREIKESISEDNLEMPPQKSPPESTKRVEVPVVTSGSTIPHNTSVDTTRSQRATRHKKINFLEMLRGDMTSQTTEDSEDLKKSSNKIQNDTSEMKKKNMIKDRKVKIVNYSIETDSSEETESVESDDYSSEYCDTDTTSEVDSPIVAHHARQRKVPQKLVTKIKSKVKPVPKPFSNKPPLKLKLGLKRPKPTATSTPTSVQFVNKSTGTAAQVYRSKMSSKLKNYEVLKSSIPSIVGQNVLKNSEMTMKGNGATTVSTCENSTSTGDCVSLDNVSEIGVNSDIIIKPYRPEIADTHELKVSPTLPDDILQTVDSSDSHVPEVGESLDKNNENASSSIDENVIDVKAVDAVESKSEIAVEGMSNDSVMSDIGFRSISPVAHAGSSMSASKRKKISHVGDEEMALRVVHRDSSPLNLQRARSQLGEVFVNRYHNKKSMCVRCYTCRKMMSVDNFLRHLHDISGGLVNLSSPQTIDPSEADLSEQEVKLWESFQRKKELFDNNQLPSPDIMKHNIGYDDSNSNGLVSDLGCVDDDIKKQDGPKIINTPVSPLKKEKVVRKNRIIGLSKSHSVINQPNVIKKTPLANIETPEGVRTSSRKRKVKHLDGFEDYSFSKFPRLMKNAVVEEENS